MEVVLVLAAGVEAFVVTESEWMDGLTEGFAVGVVVGLLEDGARVGDYGGVVPLMVSDIVAEFAEGLIETGRSIPSPIFGYVKGQYGESLFHLANIRNWGEFASNLMGILKKRTS